ncbi:hypothetical protein [Paenibacillus sedimenti]|uniref:Uncharacterized protein n=1 Tax=Paenibacillus sedimenti TaxID=2770274 RepID=A0A926QJM5_9BACL|nr:hypothetical protein [Paenibacillus sedimenti]MBD0380577.1 hypothetical protein [Paenibacillus sedimenti]
MTSEQQKAFEEIMNHETVTTNLWVEYWKHYSNLSTWQFWFNIACLLLPLIFLWFLMDKRRAFQLGFYGFSIHMMATYIHEYGVREYLWGFPYMMFPPLPASVSLDASLAPIAYMLMYQWTLNRKKNYYLAAAVLSGIFAFVYKPILSAFNLFHLYGWMNYFYLFLAYFIVVVLAKWITDLFKHFQSEAAEK